MTKPKPLLEILDTAPLPTQMLCDANVVLLGLMQMTAYKCSGPKESILIVSFVGIL
jgi:hypothetical protein